MISERERKLQILELLKQKAILKSKKNFFDYCKTTEGDFYKEDRVFLKALCDTLQALYERRIIRVPPERGWKIVDTTEGLTNYIVCKGLMLNLPPRHGKSRTLTNFTSWMLGDNSNNMVMTVSYNEDQATEFSRFTRDKIQQQRTKDEIIYSDIFPETRIAKGNAAVGKWALEGHFFNYLGTGFNGSLTGKGCNIMIIDDPIKNSEEALNEEHLNGIYKKYTDTLMSRVEGDGIQIICMTRWSKKDLCGRILDSEDADNWYVLNLPAYNEATDSMLCEQILTKENYLRLKKNMTDMIFNANYQQVPVDLKGVLYKDLKTYNKETKPPYFEHIISYTDTADEGDDYLCTIVAGIYEGEAYILDVIYTQDGMEVTEPLTATCLYKNKVNLGMIESNNGGKGFARNVIRLIWEKFRTKSVVVRWFHQSKNKKARILTNSTFVMNHIYFPEKWKTMWPEFYEAINTYQKSGKNAHDDAADALTGIAEICQKRFSKQGTKDEDEKKKETKKKSLKRNIY